MSHFTKTDINELSSLPDVAVVEYSLPTEEIQNNKSGQNSSRTPTRINQDESPDVNKQGIYSSSSQKYINNDAVLRPTPVGNNQSKTTKHVTPRSVFQKKMLTKMGNPIGDSQSMMTEEQTHTPARQGTPLKFVEESKNQAENFSFA